MNEWGVVSVIIALIGLIFTVGKPIISLNTSIVKLTQAVERLQTDTDNLRANAAKLETGNRESHARLFQRVENHETRLVQLESQK